MEMTNNIVSCKTISIDELAKTTPVNPLTVNRNTNPRDHKLLMFSLSDLRWLDGAAEDHIFKNCKIFKKIL